MTKVMFNEQTSEYYGVIEGVKTPITQAECYRYINSLGVKCYGSDENGYVIYAK